METATQTQPAAGSHSVNIKPNDSRCRFWSKIIRAGKPLPVPAACTGANDIPGDYARPGDEELFEGDMWLKGEARHHIKRRGWWYRIYIATKSGELVSIGCSNFSDHKAQLKARGLPPHLLTGSGEIAAMIRIAHGYRLGLYPEHDAKPEAAPEAEAANDAATPEHAAAA